MFEPFNPKHLTVVFAVHATCTSVKTGLSRGDRGCHVSRSNARRTCVACLSHGAWRHETDFYGLEDGVVVEFARD